MPAEGWKEHTHIDPRNSNSADLLIIVLSDLKDGRVGLVDIVDIERWQSIIEVVVSWFGTGIHRESWAVLMYRQISSIFNGNFVLLLNFGVVAFNSSYNVPVLIFHLWFFSLSFDFKLGLVCLFEVFCIVGKRFDAVLFDALVEGLNIID